MNENQSNSFQPGAFMKILLATDCHLGYETKTKRAQDNDSFVTFEEILKLGSEHDVDFILLGGDLFHDSKPSQKIVKECLKLLKQYCLGNREVRVNFLTDPELVFSLSEKKRINYEDDNMNISLPIMTIHGNHDNPSFESTGTLDILQASGLINYFGKWNSLTQITVTPLLFEKDGVHVAIYGLGYVGEQRLSRLIETGQVHFQRPDDGPERFNILVLHQNRARHAENNYVSDNSFPSWFNFILWGHEHECRIKPELVSLPKNESYYICQPGSSIATSLCEGEAVEKCVGLLSINSDAQFKLKKIKLQTVRSFIMDTLTVSKLIRKEYCNSTQEALLAYVDDYIANTMIPKAQKQLTGHPLQPTVPLIRLKININEDWQSLDTMIISNKYRERVANPMDIILICKEKKGRGIKEEPGHNNDLGDILDNDKEEDQDYRMNVQGTIKKIFIDKGMKMNVLSVAGLNEALGRCVDANDDEAFEDIFQHQTTKQIKYLSDLDVDLTKDDSKKNILKYRESFIINENNDEDEIRELQNYLNNAEQRNFLRQQATQARVELNNDPDGHNGAVPTTKGRGRGSRGGRPRGSTRGKGRGATAKNTLDTTVVETPSTPTTTRVKLPTKDLFSRAINACSQSLSQSVTQASAKANPRAGNYISSSDSD